MFVGIFCAWSVQGQRTTQATFLVEIFDPEPGCEFSSMTDLNFGAWQVPRGVSGSVTADPASGQIGSDVLVGGSGSTIGYVSVRYLDVTSMMVEVSWPDDLDNEDESASLSFSGQWAQRADNLGDYTAVMMDSYSESSLGGMGSEGDWHFRFGGEVSGIDDTVSADDYDNSASVVVTCS